MKKRSLLLGLSLMTAVSPVSLLAGPGHGNEEHSEGFFSRLKNAVFASYGEQLPFGRVGKSSEVSKKVAIELNDQFRFSPEVIPVAVGDTNWSLELHCNFGTSRIDASFPGYGA